MSEERKKRETPLLDELEKGPWPSFVKEIKKAETSPMAEDLLGVLERSYEEKIGHWKHGGIVGVMGYGGGVIGRYSDLPEEFPEVAAVPHHPRQPARRLVLHLRRAAQALRHLGAARLGPHQHARRRPATSSCSAPRPRTSNPLSPSSPRPGFDLGGSGSDMRTPSCCVGPARCEWACFDTLEGLLRPHAGSSRTSCTGRRSPTSSRSSSPAARTTAWPRSRAPTCRSSAPGGTTSRSTRPQVKAYADGGKLDIAEGRVRPLPDPVHDAGTARRSPSTTRTA